MSPRESWKGRCGVSSLEIMSFGCELRCDTGWVRQVLVVSKVKWNGLPNFVAEKIKVKKSKARRKGLLRITDSKGYGHTIPPVPQVR